MLGVLNDFGLNKNTPAIARACEYVFSTQLPDGSFGWAPPPTSGECFTGILTGSLTGLGYRSDRRIQKAYRWIGRRQRNDGGFWCKNTGQPGGPREGEPSCAYGSLCVLGALSMNNKLKSSEITSKAIDFLLGCWDNRGKIKFAGHDSQIGRGWEKLKYPFTDYRILKYLDILTRFDKAKSDSRVYDMVDMLISKGDPDGRFHAESIHKAWSDFDFGQKKSPSRWITCLVYRIIKRVIEV
jgi:prenyltransferase beta subunit